MVSSIDELLQTIRLNPYIDGVGYFIEVTTQRPVDGPALSDLQGKMEHAFCDQAEVTAEDPHVLGLDFHDHLPTQGDEGRFAMDAVADMLHFVDQRFAIDHLCVEFQFDLGRAKRAKVQVDDLLQP